MTAHDVPSLTVVDAGTGALDGATGRYEKRLGDLEGVYSDAVAYRRLAAQEPDRLHYHVHEHRRRERPGDVIFGTSVVLPGTVGREFHLTRGHVHRLADRSEIYHCLSGRGVLLMERDGDLRAIELSPGAIAYVPGHWAHRSVNVGDDPLVTVFCYPADAGQDYAPIERRGGMARLVVRDEDAGWTLVDNPRYVREHA